jgi:hypothetical protein
MPWSSLSPEIIKGLTHPFALLRQRHRAAVIALWIVALGIGCLVEIRGALIHNRHTDVDTYFAAAWSVRIGSDPYYAQDTNGWHYNYPLLLAVLIDPLADAPPTMHRYWLLPFSWSVGIWYVLSILFLVVGVTQLSRAVLQVIGRQAPTGAPPDDDPRRPPVNSAARWAWRWWILCFWPMLLCLPAIVRSVIRGQVGPLWLMLICMTAASLLQKKSARAGGWLAGAVCLKLIPAFLLIYPLWRRDLRMLAGCAAGLLLGLILIPWTAMGTRPFVDANRHYVTGFLLPGITGGRIDPAVEHELTDPVTSDTESFKAVLMNLGAKFFGTERSYTPPLFARAGAWLIGGAMTVATLYAAGPRRITGSIPDPIPDPIDDLLLFGLLSVIVLPLAPVCHPHYFMLMIPLIAAVLAAHLGPRGRRRVGPGWIVLLLMVPASHIITGSFAVQFLRDAGLDTWVAVAFWAGAARLLYDRTRQIDRDPPAGRWIFSPVLPQLAG